MKVELIDMMGRGCHERCGSGAGKFHRWRHPLDGERDGGVSRLMGSRAGVDMVARLAFKCSAPRDGLSGF